ncbi:uncharacterized protein LOC142631044 isoform X2 [Castanea sativa]|uniref:uncharacterized protein LOC142631044 isoform X2 n=1 Tax=Castanea sativa TaxID=21020 RepID=UPI003F654070
MVANDSAEGQGGRSVRVKGTTGVGKGPNDELALNSDQHPDRHTKGTGSSTVGLGKILVHSGDNVDLTKMNDIGESWNNFSPPLGGAGTKSKDDVGHEVDNFEANGNLDRGDGDKCDSKDEYYKQVKQQQALRTSAGSSSSEPVDGNFQVTYQKENIVSDEGINRRVGGDEHDEGNRDEGNDEDRRRVGDLESGTRWRVRNSSNMTLVATFITVAVQSTSAIFALSLGELSPLAQKLFTAVLVTNLVGFLSLYVALTPSRYISPRAAEILVRVGGAAAAFGFLLMMGIRLSLGIIVPACVVILAAFLLSFMP